MWSNLICRCGHCKALAPEVMLLDPAYVSSSPSPIQFRSELVRPALLILYNVHTSLSNVHTSLSSMASPNLSSAGSGTASAGRRTDAYKKGETRMWDVGGDYFDSLSGVGLLEVAELSIDEPELQAVSFGLGDAEVEGVEETGNEEEA